MTHTKLIIFLVSHSSMLLTFSAGAAEGQSGVHLIFDLDQGVKNHWATTT